MGQMALAVGPCAHVPRRFQLSLDTTVVPNLWKRSTIVPIPKNNQPREFNDERPVAEIKLLLLLR